MTDTPMITVATSGDFMLLDRDSGAEISHEGGSTVPLTQFVRDRIALGQLFESDDEGNRVEGKLADEAELASEEEAEEAPIVSAEEGDSASEEAELNPLDRDGDGKPGGSLPGNRTAPRRGRQNA